MENIVKIGFITIFLTGVISLYIILYSNFYIGILLLFISMVQLNINGTLHDEQTKLKILRG
jgi:hypothetical protein